MLQQSHHGGLQTLIDAIDNAHIGMSIRMVSAASLPITRQREMVRTLEGLVGEVVVSPLFVNNTQDLQGLHTYQKQIMQPQARQARI